MRTFLPNWDRAGLESTARAHAAAMSLERGCGDGAGGNIDRLVVKMCRHEFSTYDEDQTEKAHRAACLAIKAKYPWLGGECDRQIAQRARDEAERAGWFQAMEDERLALAAARRARSAASGEAIAKLCVGMVVGARIRGHDRVATITKLARRRVEVSYTIKTGAERHAALYAAEVSPRHGALTR